MPVCSGRRWTKRRSAVDEGGQSRRRSLCGYQNAHIQGDFREDLLEILPYIDYLFPNENEASYYCRIMTGEEQRTLAGMGSVFLQYGVKNVIIKTGEKGCTAVSGNGSFQIPARKVKAVDSTAVILGRIYSRAAVWVDLRKCCDYGTHCAAVSVQYVGAVTGIKQQKMNGSRTNTIK